MDSELLREAVKVLEHARQTHVEWIDYLTNENPEFDTEHVGDVEHHQWFLSGYDPAIEALRKYANPDYEAAIDRWWAEVGDLMKPTIKNTAIDRAVKNAINTALGVTENK